MKLLLRKSLVVAAVAAWVAATGFGFHRLAVYEITPGEPAAAPPQWPSSSSIARNPRGATLVMFVHPQCSCSAASLGELSRVMTKTHGLADAYVFFFQPAGFATEWTQSTLWHTAAGIDGVHPLIDADAREAKLFRASTSGSVVLYNEAGDLIFEGGITPSRGHFGDSVGRSAIIDLLMHGGTRRDSTFVFGCPIFKVSAL